VGLSIKAPRQLILGSWRLTTRVTGAVEPWIGNAAAVLSDAWGAVTRRSEHSG
jgi:hypothetical protein